MYANTGWAQVVFMHEPWQYHVHATTQDMTMLQVLTLPWMQCGSPVVVSMVSLLLLEQVKDTCEPVQKKLYSG